MRTDAALCRQNFNAVPANGSDTTRTRVDFSQRGDGHTDSELRHSGREEPGRLEEAMEVRSTTTNLVTVDGGVAAVGGVSVIFCSAAVLHRVSFAALQSVEAEDRAS